MMRIRSLGRGGRSTNRPVTFGRSNRCRTLEPPQSGRCLLGANGYRSIHSREAAPTRESRPTPPLRDAQLIRRAYFDLIGLPPTPADVEAFMNDEDPQAYEKLLDRLLDSEHHGERVGRHWLDIARFAESHGFEQDYDRPYAYHYRDFVIQAFNADMPFDQFVRWQLAGDEIEPENPLAMMATGFLGAGVFPTQLTEKEFESSRYDELDDMVATIGTAMLGMTVGCARCHDHKFDPIPARDYYQLISAFRTTIRSNVEIDLDPSGTAAALAKWEAELAPLQRALDEFEQSKLQLLELTEGEQLDDTRRKRLMGVYKTTDPQWRSLNELLQKHLAAKPIPKLTTMMVSSEGVKPIPNHGDGRGFPHFYNDAYFLGRGDVNQKQGIAEEGFLQVLMRADSPEESDPASRWRLSPPEGCRTSLRRRAVADWITDTEHGAGHLLARVIVNRLWQQHLGRGIVGNAERFRVSR